MRVVTTVVSTVTLDPDNEGLNIPHLVEIDADPQAPEFIIHSVVRSLSSTLSEIPEGA